MCAVSICCLFPGALSVPDALEMPLSKLLRVADHLIKMHNGMTKSLTDK